MIRETLDKEGIEYQYLDGSTPAKERQRRVDAFQEGEGDLFLISLKAGGTGLNLTGADYVIHLDPWWNPAVEDQATDRAHRIGQDRPVTVYRLVAEGTIEEQILELHADKRELVAGVLDGTDRAAKMNTDDLINLIKEGRNIGAVTASAIPIETTVSRCRWLRRLNALLIRLAHPPDNAGYVRLGQVRWVFCHETVRGLGKVNQFRPAVDLLGLPLRPLAIHRSS